MKTCTLLDIYVHVRLYFARFCGGYVYNHVYTMYLHVHVCTCTVHNVVVKNVYIPICVVCIHEDYLHVCLLTRKQGPITTTVCTYIYTCTVYVLHIPVSVHVPAMWNMSNNGMCVGLADGVTDGPRLCRPVNRRPGRTQPPAVCTPY